MGRIEDQVLNNSVFTHFSSITNLYSNIHIEKFDNENVISELLRVGKVISLMQTIFEDIDPELTALSTLNSIASHLSTANTQLNSFITSNNISHLNSCNDNLSNILPLLSSLGRIRTSTRAKATVKQLKDMDSTSEHLIKEFTKNKNLITESNKTIETNLKKLEERIDAQTIRLDNAVSEYQSKFLETP